MLRCLFAGDCPVQKDPVASTSLVEATRRSMQAADDEFQPLRDRIEQDRRERPDLAAELRRARAEHWREVGS
jgi:predicted ABC-class ATPase